MNFMCGAVRQMQTRMRSYLNQVGRMAAMLKQTQGTYVVCDAHMHFPNGQPHSDGLCIRKCISRVGTPFDVCATRIRHVTAGTTRSRTR